MDDDFVLSELGRSSLPEVAEVLRDSRVLRQDFSWAKKGTTFKPVFSGWARCHWCGRVKKNHPTFAASVGRIVPACIVCARDLISGWDPPRRARCDEQ